MMDDIIKGSGLADTEELYSREAHRKRALEMYNRTTQQMPASISPTVVSPAATSPDNSYYSATQQADNNIMVSPENSSTMPATGLERCQSGDSRFSLIMETFQVFKPTKPEVKVMEVSKEPSDEAKVKNTISVSGNYIPPPPNRLGFARRTGKFHPSTASVDLERILREQTVQATAPLRLRVLKDGEGTHSKF